ncbi:hypothetical protein ACRRUX_08050 [Shewanella sp. GXUN23E]
MSDNPHGIARGALYGAIVGLVFGTGIGLLVGDLWSLMALWLVTGVILGMLVDFVRLDRRK